MLLSACAPATVIPQTRLVIPDVPAPLRQPCPGPDFAAATAKQAALVLIDTAEALDCANGRITAIDTILTQAEGAN
jgi:hypothetical protein